LSTVAQSLIRIFSDLHYGDGTSWLRSLWSLRPLLDGADTVIINGDAVDSQSGDEGPGLLSEVQAFFTAHVPNPVFITGNHDPDISGIHELSLADNSIWITHGDVLFSDIAPWGTLVEEHRRRLARLGAHLSAAERATIETRLKLHRLACFNSKHGFDLTQRNLVHRAVRLARTVLPPQRVVAMMRAWRDTPRIAANLAEGQRPSAKFVLLGHISRASGARPTAA
jgi:precorrin-6B methylase 1